MLFSTTHARASELELFVETPSHFIEVEYLASNSLFDYENTSDNLIDFSLFERTPDPRKKVGGFFVGDVLSVNASYYSAGAGSNGKWAGTTAMGIKVWDGMPNPYLIACNFLPLGTKVKIDGTVYMVADRGGASRLRTAKWVDIYVPEGESYAYKKGLTYGHKMEILG